MKSSPFVFSHQTVRLTRGRHRSPAEGVCAVELSSMLAGEPFSDRPDCVSPVIGAFLRRYNDLLLDGRRQDLYEFAATAVGTRASRAQETERARLCLEWLRAQLGDAARNELRLLNAWPNTRTKRERIAERAARYAAASRDRHAAALDLIMRLAASTGDPGRQLLQAGGVERVDVPVLAMQRH